MTKLEISTLCFLGFLFIVNFVSCITDWSSDDDTSDINIGAMTIIIYFVSFYTVLKLLGV